MDTLTAAMKLDGRGKSITTFVVYEAARILEEMAVGETLQIMTDDFAPFASDISAWCSANGHRLAEVTHAAGESTYVIEKGTPPPSVDKKLAMVKSVCVTPMACGIRRPRWCITTSPFIIICRRSNSSTP